MLIRYNDRQYSQFVNVKIGDCIRYKDELFIKIGDAKTLKNEHFTNAFFRKLKNGGLDMRNMTRFFNTF